MFSPWLESKKMSSNSKILQIDLAAGVIRKWKETYRWIPIFGAVAAISMAFSVGANNLPAPVCVFSVRTYPSKP